jgi:hypothetical protein
MNPIVVEFVRFALKIVDKKRFDLVANILEEIISALK